MTTRHREPEEAPRKEPARPEPAKKGGMRGGPGEQADRGTHGAFEPDPTNPTKAPPEPTRPSPRDLDATRPLRRKPD